MAMIFRGFRLAQRERVRSGRVDLSRLTCRASQASDGSPPLCGDTAAWLLTAACAHEHVVPSLACGIHAGTLRGREILCTPCARGPEPHACPVTIEFRPLDGDAGRNS